MAGVNEVKLTGRAEVAVAVRASGVPCNWLAGSLKVIVCGFPFTVKLCETGVAAA